MLFTRMVRQAVKETTGIFGIAVHPNPRPALLNLYRHTLYKIESLPETSVYRKSVQAIVFQRLSVVQKEEDVQKIESTIGAGQIEELILQAEDELKLIDKMAEWKPWEPLEVPAPPGQWEYFGGQSS
ncbi:ETC complex I subunit conserved region-domain-containing protein [Cladochytrium replicatum]|nr:ETC complex I subunit conserved region-domain-containing protein [Cladochytrium replicatum]